MKLEDIVKLQEEWQELKQRGKMTKNAIRELCVPFRDKFNLTDFETLKIARNELLLNEIDVLLKRGV